MVEGAVRDRAMLEVEIATTARARANEAQMIQIVLNLVMNAVQAIPVGNPLLHRIRIDVREVDRVLTRHPRDGAREGRRVVELECAGVGHK